MGTQQILLIVLSVIIVGIAIVVGIMMFNNGAYNANKQQIASELTHYGSIVAQWWKTPVAQGGAGQNPTNLNIADIADYVGFNEANYSISNSDVGEFRITAASQADTTVTLTGLGTASKLGIHPKVTTTIILSEISIVATTEDDDNF